MITRAYRTLVSGVADLIWPRRCWLCETETAAALCDPCRDALTADVLPTCPRCAGTVGPHTDLTDGCPQCRSSRLRFDAAVRLGPYDGRLREAVIRIKHGPGEPLAEELGGLLATVRAESLTAHRPDVVVPVPLHWWRRWGRGYNQSEAVARLLADRLGLPCWPGWLARTRPTPSQRAQSAAARWANVRGAFRVRRGVTARDARVLLVDDVMTTGATADAAATTLRQAGAAQVIVAVLARR
ncbi:MAG TPA: phosphoribosyltransferase family protein [Fimbriiglobus sp.]|nr:phosphoribosyltransferase family protein [Fimbriiglobus sp.]